MKKILITGAAGFAGMHSCRHFLEKGYEVIGIVRRPAASISGVSQLKVDLTIAEEVERVIQDFQPDMILHLAAQNHTGISWDFPLNTITTNVIGTLNLLEALRRHSRKAVILVAGSILEYNPCSDSVPQHPYGLSKYMQSLTAVCWKDLYGLDVRIAKSSNMIGPGPSNGICSMFAKKCLEDNESFHFINLLDRRDFIDVRDVVSAYEMILVDGVKDQTYVIASGKYKTLLEAAKTIKTIIGSNVTITADQFSRIQTTRLDITNIQNLGWRQTIPFETSIKDIIQYLNGN